MKCSSRNASPNIHKHGLVNRANQLTGFYVMAILAFNELTLEKFSVVIKLSYMKRISENKINKVSK